jgi:hypothetical protein
MTEQQIIQRAYAEDWTCERVAIELEAIGLTKAQVKAVMMKEIVG